MGFERTDMSAFLFSNFFRHALGIGVTSSGFWVQKGGFLLGIPYANGFEIPWERNPHSEQKYFSADKIPPLPNEPLLGHSGPSPTVVLANDSPWNRSQERFQEESLARTTVRKNVAWFRRNLHQSTGNLSKVPSPQSHQPVPNISSILRDFTIGFLSYWSLPTSDEIGRLSNIPYQAKSVRIYQVSKNNEIAFTFLKCREQEKNSYFHCYPRRRCSKFFPNRDSNASIIIPLCIHGTSVIEYQNIVVQYYVRWASRLHLAVGFSRLPPPLKIF